MANKDKHQCIRFCLRGSESNFEARGAPSLFACLHVQKHDTFIRPWGFISLGLTTSNELHNET